MFRRPLQTLIDRHCRRRYDLEQVQAQANAIRADLRALEKQIRAEYPGFHAKDWPSFRKKLKRHHFKSGTWSSGAFRVIRKADQPMSAREIALVVLHDLQVKDARPLLDHVEAAVLSALKRAEYRGAVVGAGHAPVVWQRAKG